MQLDILWIHSSYGNITSLVLLVQVVDGERSDGKHNHTRYCHCSSWLMVRALRQRKRVCRALCATSFLTVDQRGIFDSSIIRHLLGHHGHIRALTRRNRVRGALLATGLLSLLGTVIGIKGLLHNLLGTIIWFQTVFEILTQRDFIVVQLLDMLSIDYYPGNMSHIPQFSCFLM